MSRIIVTMTDEEAKFLGLPAETSLKELKKRLLALEAFDEVKRYQATAQQSGISQMTMEEIIEEIALSRRETGN